MVKYIYFVKCPNCEAEPFDFFEEAKEFAISCLTKKPVITQVECCHNDNGFGERIGSNDLGVVWSWEDMMKDIPEESELATFSKSETLDCDDDYFNCEFDDLDNSLDSVPDNFRKPVPADMTIEELVEAMEENEDEVECKNCGDLYDKSEMHKETGYGYLCHKCSAGTKSKEGDQLTFNEVYRRDPFDHHDSEYDEDEAAEYLAHLMDTAVDSRYDDALDTLDEAVSPANIVELHYDSLTTEITTKVIPATHWDPPEYVEEEYTDEFDYQVDTGSVEEALWDHCLTDEDVADVPGGLEALEDDAAWKAFLELHFEELLDKYNDKLLELFREDAEEAATEEFQRRYKEEMAAAAEEARAYRYNEDVEEQGKSNELLEESDDAFCAWRSACPECGIEEAFDHAKGKCTQCGFSTKKRIVEEADYGEQDIFELEYEELPVTIGFESVKDPFNPECTPDYTEESLKVSYLYKVSREELVKALGETILPPETLENPRLPSNPKDLWVYADENLEDLFDRYQTQLLDFFEESAAYAFEDEYSKGYGKAFDQVEAILGDRYESED
jgi:hypothetical protein